MFTPKALQYTRNGKTYRLRPNQIIDLRNHPDAPEEIVQMGNALNLAYQKRTTPGFFSMLFNK